MGHQHRADRGAGQGFVGDGASRRSPVLRHLSRGGRGTFSWILALFLIPFILVGIGLVALAIYQALQLSNPRPNVTVKTSIVALGDELPVDWSTEGRVEKLTRFSITLEAREEDPYAVHRVLRERYRLSASAWHELMARLERLGQRGAIVGPHGSGKTTLLEDLAGRLEGHGWRIHLLRLNADQRRLAFLSRWEGGDFVLCDGAEQLSFLDWRRLVRRAASAGGLVITTHRAGRLPLLRNVPRAVAQSSRVARRATVDPGMWRVARTARWQPSVRR